MDRPLVARQGVDAAYGIPDNVSRLGAAIEGSNPPKKPLSCAYKVSTRPPFTGASLPLRLTHILSSVSLSQSTYSLMWISDLIFTASTCSQPITHSYPYASIIESGFQLLKPPPSSDASLFGCTARFDLSTMDASALISGRRFQALSAVGQSIPPACADKLAETRDELCK
jgi:hypothetical protein